MKQLCIALFLSLSVCAFAQETPASKPDPLKFSKAVGFFDSQNYDGCLFTLEPLLRKNPDDPGLNYYAGRSNLELKNYKEAFEQITASYYKEPQKYKDILFWVGRAWQEIHNPDSALAYYAKYKSTAKGNTLKFNDVDYYEKQMKNYKKALANPAKVKFTNVGPQINTEFEEAAPSINAEGNTLIFTSRRVTTTGGQRDPNDNKFFQDIYMAQKDTNTGKWKEAVNMTRLNTPEHEANMTITPDGNSIFIYKNTVGKTGSGDIWYSRRRKNDDWSKPKEFEGPFNTSYFETSASIASGGKILYFVTENPGGKSIGQGDLWMCERINRKEWGKPVNMGNVLNTPYDEVCVYIHPDGKTLFFSSKGHDSFGGYDIFKSEFKDGKWTAPVNLGYPINTPGDEIHFTVTSDGKKAYMSARRPDSEGDLDIYEVDLSDYQILNTNENSKGVAASGKILSVFKGSVKDGSAPLPAKIVITDASGVEAFKGETDDNGDFFFTLEGGKQYKVSIQAEGFKDAVETFYLDKKAGDTPFTFVKDFTLLK